MFSDFWVEFLRLTNKLLKLDPTVVLFSSPHLREHDDDDDDDDDDDGDGDDDDDDDDDDDAGDATHWTGWEREKRCTDPMSFVFPLLVFLRCWIS